MTAIPVRHAFELGTVAVGGKLVAAAKKPKVIVRFARAPIDAELWGIQNLMRDKWPEWRKIIGGARAEQTTPARLESQQLPDCLAYEEVHSDGLIEMAFASVNRLPGIRQESWDHRAVPPKFWDDMPLVMLVELACWAEKLSTLAGAANAEYIIDVRIRIASPMLGKSKVKLTSRHSEERPASRLPKSTREDRDSSFAQYTLPVGEQEEIMRVLAQFNEDLWRRAGIDISGFARDYKLFIKDE